MVLSVSIEQLFGARTAKVIPDVVDSAAAAEVRARLRYTRYALLDRGSYDAVDRVDEPALLSALTRVVAGDLARTLVIAEARAVRLRAGDYILAHHDRVHEGLPLELVLDLSPAHVPGAEVHYRRRGQVFFRAPSAPGALAVVERGPTVTCNHTYVSKLHSDAEIVRLIAILRDA